MAEAAVRVMIAVREIAAITAATRRDKRTDLDIDMINPSAGRQRGWPGKDRFS